MGGRSRFGLSSERIAPDERIVTPTGEAELIDRIDAAGLPPFHFQGWLGKRLTRWFSWSYDFDTGRFAPTDSMPEWLLPARVRAAAFAGLTPDDLVQALLIRYDPGAGIGWHKDRPVFEHGTAKRAGDRVAEDAAHEAVDSTKHALGERGRCGGTMASPPITGTWQPPLLTAV